MATEQEFNQKLLQLYCKFHGTMHSTITTQLTNLPVIDDFIAKNLELKTRLNELAASDLPLDNDNLSVLGLRSRRLRTQYLHLTLTELGCINRDRFLNIHKVITANIRAVVKMEEEDKVAKANKIQTEFDDLVKEVVHYGKMTDQEFSAIPTEDMNNLVDKATRITDEYKAFFSRELTLTSSDESSGSSSSDSGSDEDAPNGVYIHYRNLCHS